MREGNRIVGYVVERESEWDDEQRALVRGVFEYERMLGSHGQPMDEATNPDADWDYVAGVTITDPFTGREISGVPVLDRAEKARRDMEDAYREANKDKTGFSTNGMFWPVSRVERPKPQD